MRDLLVVAALFGTVTIVWAGWAQERPPAGVAWRIVLGALSVAGLALVGLSVPSIIRTWSAPTAITSGSPALIAYIVVFWAEVIVIAALAIYYARTKRTHLLAPSVLIVVGVHFAPLAAVFQQPVLILAAVLITAAGVAALLLPRRSAAPSFWCGILASPIFLAIGTTALIASRITLDG